MRRPATRLISAAVVCAGLAACSQAAGVGANVALKAHQTETTTELEKRLTQRFAAEPPLAGLKISVARANVWQDGFQSRYNVLLAGTVPDADSRNRAAAMVRETIGGDPAAIAILDRSRLTPVSSPE
jgi:hypothetical protein